jgi:hypothetical protein
MCRLAVPVGVQRQEAPPMARPPAEKLAVRAQEVLLVRILEYPMVA